MMEALARPLIVQLCGNNPTILHQAVQILLNREEYPIDAIDFNLGCPQERAKAGLFGSYLLDKVHWPLVFKCVQAMRNSIEEYRSRKSNENMDIGSSSGLSLTKASSDISNITLLHEASLSGEYQSAIDISERIFHNKPADIASFRHDRVPLFCKIRYCEGSNKFASTKEFCEGLILHGASAICIHGRLRGSDRSRRAGPADIDTIKLLSNSLKDRAHIILNGNITTIEDINNHMKYTRDVSGLMSAEGILTDPALFCRNGKSYDCPAVSPSSDGSEGHLPIRGPSRYELFAQYCQLSEAYKESGGWSEIDKGYNCRSHMINHIHETDSNAKGVPLGPSNQSDSRTHQSPSGNSDAVSSGISSSLLTNEGSNNRPDMYDNVSGLEPSLSDSLTGDLVRNNSIEKSKESQQIIFARNHLLWMLGKEGHGRTVRFKYVTLLSEKSHAICRCSDDKSIAMQSTNLDYPWRFCCKCVSPYESHAEVYQEILQAENLRDLLKVAENCLQNIYESMPFQSSKKLH